MFHRAPICWIATNVRTVEHYSRKCMPERLEQGTQFVMKEGKKKVSFTFNTKNYSTKGQQARIM
jgi:hypothetical protein